MWKIKREKSPIIPLKTKEKNSSDVCRTIYCCDENPRVFYVIEWLDCKHALPMETCS